MKPYFAVTMVVALVLHFVSPAIFGWRVVEAAVEPTVSISPISGYESVNMYANGDSVQPAISADGKYVAFISNASNLTSDGADLEERLEYDQVYLYDRQTGITTLVSVDISGTSPSNGDNRNVSISADGQYVAFESDATNLINDDLNGYSDIFVWNRDTMGIKRVSVSDSGREAAGASSEPSISADGTLILFKSEDIGLEEAQNYGDYPRRYRANLDTGEMNRMLMPAYSTAVISGDGCYAVIEDNDYLYKYDFQNDIWSILLQPDSDDEHDGIAFSYQSPVISHDGRYIAFRESKWIGSFDSASIKVMDTALEEDHITEIGPVEDNSYDLAMSPNGRYISFIASTASYPAIAPPPMETWEGAQDLYVWDRHTASITMASDFMTRGSNLAHPSISNYGTIAFESVYDIYVSHSPSSTVGWNSGASLTFTLVEGEPVLAWPDPQSDQIEGFHIFKEVSTFNGPITTYLGHANAGDRSFSLADANMQEGHRIKVYAINGEYNRSASPLSGEFHIADTEGPYWPNDNANLRASYTDTSAPRLDWNSAMDNSGSIASYTIWRIVNEGRSEFAESATNYLSLIDLQPATSYTFVVQAQDASGNWSSDSEPVTFQTLSAHAETGVLTGQFADDAVTLNWTPSQYAAGSDAYRIMRVVPGHTPEQIASVGAGTTTYTDIVTPGITYYYQVKGYDLDHIVIYQTNLIEVSTGTIAPPVLVDYTASSVGVQLAMNSALAFIATADTGMSVETIIAYETWFDEGGKKRAFPRQVEASAALVEDPDEPGTYEGNWELPAGASKVVSLQPAIILGGNHKVRGGQLQLNKQVTASAVITFNIAHLNEGYRTQLQDALTNADAMISLEEGEYAEELAFTSFDQSYTFNDLPSGGTATVAVGDYFANQQVKLLPGIVNRIVLSTVKVNPTLTVSVVDTHNQPLSNMEVKFFDSDGDERFRGLTNDNGNVTTSRLPIGSGTVRVGVQNTLYHPQPDQDVEISITPVQRTFVMQAVDAHTLTGTIKDKFDVPIEGVKVSVSQGVNDGYQFNYGVTGTDGRYTVNAYEGEATVYLSHYQKQLGFPEHALLNLTGAQSTYNPTVNRYEEGYVFLKLYVKKLNGEVVGPYKIDRETLLRWNVSLQDSQGKRDTYGEYPIRTWGIPGDEIQLCIAGVENQDAVCKKVTTDMDNSALIEITVEEESRFEARLVEDGALYQLEDFQFRLERWQADTQQWAFFKQFHSNPLSEPLPAGRYRYEASTNNGVSTSGEFETQLGDLNNLGDIELVQSGYFAGRTGNGLVAMSSQVLPGEMVTMRGALRNSDMTVSGAKLSIEIPAGTELVPGSIQVQYSAGTTGITIEDTSSPAIVQFGELLPNTEGTVTYRLKVSDTYKLPELTARLRLLWSGGEEMIGRTTIPTTLISLQAPSTVYSDKLLLNGRAPGGSVVTIYDGHAVIGQTVAYPGGYWNKEVQLSDLGQPSRHLLRAEAAVADQVKSTPTHTLMFDIEDVRMEELVMKQFNGKEVVIRPENGVARFPFTINPHAPTLFAVYFNEPDRIEIAQIRFTSDEPVIMEKDEHGVFRADIIPGYTAGAVYVEYKVKKQSQIRLQGDADEIRAKLPPHLRNFDHHVEVTPVDTETGSLGGARFDLGDYAVRTETFAFPAASYELTEEEELAVAENRAPKAFGADLDWKVEGATLSLTVTYYQEEAAPLASKGSKREVQILGVTKVLKKIQQEIVMTVKNPEKMNKLRKKAEEINDTIEEGQGALEMIRDNFDASNDFADRMDRLVNLAQLAATCPPANDQWNKHIVGAIDQIAALSAYSTVISVADFLNPFSFDEIGIDPVGAVVDFINEKAIDGRIDGLESGVLFTIMHKCDDDTPEDRPGVKLTKGSDGEGDGSSSGAGGSGWGGGKAASPVYIYDPSGYIYEAVPSNRIMDATVNLYEQQEDDSWTLWDAEWFGLENPQISDAEGKYGWDVPFGNWQVVVNKDGYLPAESAELVVPPQHFDVNIPIVSLEPPTVADVQAWTVAGSGSSEIIMTFSKYIEASLIGDESIVVTGDNGVITGRVEPVNVEQDLGGRDLINQLRFAADEPLQAGEQLIIFVDSSSVTSYAGIAMLSDEEHPAVVSLKDVSGSVLQSAVVGGSGNFIRLTFDESIAPASLMNAANISLTGTDAAPSGLLVDASRPDGRTVKLLLSQSVKAGEHVWISMPAGQFRDGMQNGSVAVTNLQVGNTLPSSNARLSALEVYQDGRKITMPFQSGKSSYTVNATIGASVTVSAAAAESSSMIHIESKAYTGVPLTVNANEHGAQIPIRVTAPDGVTRGYYSVTVNRVPAAPVEDPDAGTDTGNGTGGGTGTGGGGPLAENEPDLDLTNSDDRPAVSMTDVIGHWAIGAITEAIKRGFVSGYPDHTFRPDKQITRAEFTVMLSRALQLEQRSDMAAHALDFTDAASIPSWASSHIALARSAGLVSGYEDGTFRPNKLVTRAEIVVMSARALKLAEVKSNSTSFLDDQDIPAWAKSAVSQLVSAGIIKGKSGNRFAPADQATRAEAVTILIALVAVEQ